MKVKNERFIELEHSEGEEFSWGNFLSKCDELFKYCTGFRKVDESYFLSKFGNSSYLGLNVVGSDPNIKGSPFSIRDESMREYQKLAQLSFKEMEDLKNFESLEKLESKYSLQHSNWRIEIKRIKSTHKSGDSELDLEFILQLIN